MRTYDIQLSAGVDAQRPISGKYFRIITATGDIKTRLDGGAIALLQQGIGVTRSAGFNSIILRSATAQTVRIVVSDEAIDDNRLSVPDGVAVNVIDGGVARSRSGNAYMVGYSQAASAGNYGSVQIFNPVGSGKNIIINQLALSAGAVSGVEGIINATMLGGGAFTGYNKNSTGAGVAEVRGTATPAYPIGAPLFALGMNTAPAIFRLTEPFLLIPNRGLTFYATTVNVSMSANFEYYTEVA